MTLFETRDLTCGYGARLVVEAGSLRLEEGGALSIVGMNGAGKSTFMRTLCAQIAPLRGEVLVRGVSVPSLAPGARAKLVAYLPQQQEIDPALTIEELVRLGRTPYVGRFGRLSKTDLSAVSRALDSCALRELANARLGEISGGERQRARLAMVIAGEAPLVLLDEPTTHLDMAQRFALYRTIAELRRERRTAFVIVTHAIADAERFGDSILLIEKGRTSLFGPSMRVAVREALMTSARIPEEWVY